MRFIDGVVAFMLLVCQQSNGYMRLRIIHNSNFSNIFHTLSELRLVIC